MFCTRSLHPCFISRLKLLLLVMVLPLLYAVPSLAGECDQAITRPNVLLVIDNSTSSLQLFPSQPYDPALIYTGPYLPWSIYLQDRQGEYSPKAEIQVNYAPDLENLSCPETAVRDLLRYNGVYASSGTTSRPNLRGGECFATSKGEVYALGNYLNYLSGNTGAALISGQQQIFDLVQRVVIQSRSAVNFGIMMISHKGKGGDVVAPISNLTSDDSLAEFLARIPGSGEPLAKLKTPTQTVLPLAEVLVDADAYLRGLPLPVSRQTAPLPPDTLAAGNNHIILLSTDLPRGENPSLLGALVGDADQDGAFEGSYGQGTAYLDDIAFAMYQGPNKVITSALVLGQEYDPLFHRTALNGHGRSLSIGNAAEEIVSSLLAIIMPICPVPPSLP